MGKTRYYYWEVGNGALTEAEAVSRENAYLIGLRRGSGLARLMRELVSALNMDSNIRLKLI